MSNIFVGDEYYATRIPFRYSSLLLLHTRLYYAQQGLRLNNKHVEMLYFRGG